MSLVKQINEDTMKKHGQLLIQNNEFYKDIASLFSDKSVRDFFEKYLSDPVDTQLILKISKLIIYFCKTYKEKSGIELDMNVLIHIIHETLTDPDSRKKLIYETNLITKQI